MKRKLHAWKFFDDGDYGSYWYCTICGAKERHLWNLKSKGCK